jgi:ParB family chromosome partitioning protein
VSKPPVKVLGKGLSALLPARAAAAAAPAEAPASSGLIRVALDEIDPNPSQPRTEFRADHLQELADSIRVHGVLQPLIVRRAGARYELIAGERRWRASRLAGQPDVPVIVQDVANDQLLELALIENIQREDLNPIETAQAFDRLAKEFHLSHEEIGRRTGKERATVTNMIRLLKLPPDLQTLVAERHLSMGHARAILGLPSEDMQRSVAEKAVSQGLSVRSVERLVQSVLEPREPKPGAAPIDPNVQAAIEELERTLGTRVRIVTKGNNRGTLEIDYYSQDDLDRIYQQIVKD